MSDVAQTQGSERSGNPKGGDETGDTTPSSDSGSWLDGLEPDNRELAKTKGWEEPDSAKAATAILSSYRELEGTLGNRIAIPGEDAKPEEVEKFYDRLGRPKDPNEYEFKLPEGYPEGLPYDQNFAETMKPALHKAGLTKKQADVVHGEFALAMAGLAKEHVAKTIKKVEGTHSELVKDWGPEEGEKFKSNSSTVTKVLDKLGLMDSFKAVGLVLEDGSLTDPAIARAALSMSSMFTEDDLGDTRADGDSGGGKNPWKAGEGFNVTEQGRLVRAAKSGTKTEKARVARLIREAGKDPARYGLG